MIGDEFEGPVVTGAFERVEDRGIEASACRGDEVGRARQREQHRIADFRPHARRRVQPRELTVGTEPAPALFEAFELVDCPVEDTSRRVAGDDVDLTPHRPTATLGPVLVGERQGHFDPEHGGGGGGGGGLNTVVGGDVTGEVAGGDVTWVVGCGVPTGAGGGDATLPAGGAAVTIGAGAGAPVFDGAGTTSVLPDGGVAVACAPVVAIVLPDLST